MTSLVVCATCSRHIRRHETACPFCGDAVTSDVANAPEQPMPTARLSRAALVAFAAASVGAVACNSAVYGGPPLPGAGGTVSIVSATGTGGNAIASGGATGSGGTASTPPQPHHDGHPPRPHYGGPPRPDGKPPQL